MTGFSQPGDVALVGPSATGKTDLAFALAERLGEVELVSVDALAVYKRLDIGTAKPLPTPGRPTVRLIDLAEPDEEFSVARFQEACRSVVVSAHERGARVVFVGGTGLYHRAVVDGLSLPGRYPLVLERLEERSAAPGGIEHLYGELARLDPPAAARVTPTNRRRILRALEVTIGSGRPFSSYGPGLEAYRATPVLLVGLGLARDELDRRLAERLSRQMESGFLDEVRALLDDGVELSRTARQAIGYKELIAHLEGRLPLEEAIDEISRRLRAFARRQESWFRRDPRVHWFDAGSPTLADDVLRLLKATGDVGEPCETRTS